MEVGVQAAEVKITESKFFYQAVFLYSNDLCTCRIKNCVYVDDSKRGTCARIETAVRCVNSINENCATNALFAGDLTLDYGPREVDSDEPCFHQRVDDYFNRDGVCSFEDAKK